MAPFAIGSFVFGHLLDSNINATVNEGAISVGHGVSARCSPSEGFSRTLFSGLQRRSAMFGLHRSGQFPLGMN